MRHLRIKDWANWAELSTIYQKSMGGTKELKTEPRRLHPLLLRDSDGAVIDWQLQARWQVGEALPPLHRDGDGGQALNQYLRRRKVWLALRDEAKHQGEQLKPYSLRHWYAEGCTRKMFPSPISARQWGTPSTFT